MLEFLAFASTFKNVSGPDRVPFTTKTQWEDIFSSDLDVTHET